MTPLLLVLALLAPAPAKIPKDAPWCVPPGAPQLFLSPMGEPFRAKGGEPYPAASWFARADTDRDGKIGAAEFVADAATFFRSLDKNGDAALLPDEIAAYEAVVPEIALYRPRERGERAMRGGGGDHSESAADDNGRVRIASPKGKRDDSYGGAMGAGRYGWLNIPHPLWSADADIDRAVTSAEFAAAARRRFALLDGGKRGYLVLADLGMTPEQAERAGPCRPRPKPGERPGGDKR
jgi:hypothetical protein